MRWPEFAWLVGDLLANEDAHLHRRFKPTPAAPDPEPTQPAEEV